MVVAIISIMLGVALRAVGDNRSSALLKQEINRLHAALRFAADDAILHGREWVVPQSGDYRFMVFDTDTSRWADPNEALLQQHPLPDTLALKLEAVIILSCPKTRIPLCTRRSSCSPVASPARLR